MIHSSNNYIILIDGSSYLYRAYYALPKLTNSVGEPTGAMYGVLNMLRRLLVQYQPSHIAVIFDAQDKTFRNKLFEKYKSNRKPMPDNLSNQIAPLYNMIKAMGLPLIIIHGVEADDVIGTLALKATSNNWNVLISTSDKDMAQLVSTNISIIRGVNNNLIGPKEVKIKFGVSPELIIDYLALTGDHSDNIPGVPGIGEKTTQLLLHNLGGLKNLYNHLDKINKLGFRGSKSIVTKLEQYRDIAFLSYKLATIKNNVPLDFDYNHLIIKAPEHRTLLSLFQHYEFKLWIKELEHGQWLRI